MTIKELGLKQKVARPVRDALIELAFEGDLECQQVFDLLFSHDVSCESQKARRLAGVGEPIGIPFCSAVGTM